MDYVFLKILELSMVSSVLIVAVIVLRMILSKAPKWTRYVMWIMVGLRLIIPFSVESRFSLMPKKEQLNLSTVPLTPQFSTTQQTAVIDEFDITSLLGYVWASVAVVFLLYMLISFLRIHFTIRESVLLKDNIYLCDHVSNPFVLGIIKPKIYLNSSISKKESRYIIAHEQMHIRHCDNILKPIGFFILSVHWFNPLVWVAYFLFVKDIELFCDESVVKSLGKKGKQKYSTVLLNCSTSNNMLLACPLAFAENNVKTRVKNILSYKKPAIYIVIVSVVMCIVTMVLFMTSPISAKEVDKTEVAKNHVEPQNVTEVVSTPQTQPPTVKPTEKPTQPSVDQHHDNGVSNYNTNENIVYSESQVVSRAEALKQLHRQHIDVMEEYLQRTNKELGIKGYNYSSSSNSTQEPEPKVIVWDVSPYPSSQKIDFSGNSNHNNTFDTDR